MKIIYCLLAISFSIFSNTLFCADDNKRFPNTIRDNNLKKKECIKESKGILLLSQKNGKKNEEKKDESKIDIASFKRIEKKDFSFSLYETSTQKEKEKIMEMNPENLKILWKHFLYTPAKYARIVKSNGNIIGCCILAPRFRKNNDLYYSKGKKCKKIAKLFRLFIRLKAAVMKRKKE